MVTDGMRRNVGGARRRSLMRQCVIHLASIGLIIFCTNIVAPAQEQDDPAPPPIKLLSKTERTQLAEKHDTKERTALTLQLMETRLHSAEKFRTDENYSLMYAELGGFHALMDNGIAFLLANSSEGKKLGSLKRFEITLRSFVPRLETIRRDLPLNFDPYIKQLILDVGDAREKAMRPFFSDTVISNNFK
jgi:hypothetical protein